MAVSSPETDEFSGLGTPVDEFADLGTPVAPKDEFADLGTPVLSPEEVQQEAMRNTMGAVQALDVMAAPAALDWSDVAEQADRERFQAAEQAGAYAALAEERGSGTGPGSEAFQWRRERDFQLGQISPNTSTGRMLAQRGQSELAQIEDVATTEGRQTTPSDVVSGILGPGLSSTTQPVIESAARNVGPAIGGALGAAALTPTPVGAAARFVLPLAGGFLGAQVGGGVQEEILRTTETPEETVARQQRAAEDFERNPGLSRIGASVAQLPFFRPGLAQFGRAAAGDRGAIMNLGVAGVLGGGMEVAGAAYRGEMAKAEDIAAGIFSNLIMNEPTRLGRKLGFQPSTEEAAIETAQKYRDLAPEVAPPSEFESGLATRGATSTEDVFAGVQRQPATGEPNAQQISENGTPDGGVLPPEVAPENSPLPTPEGGEGVQPSRQGEPLVENAPEAPREVAKPNLTENELSDLSKMRVSVLRSGEPVQPSKNVDRVTGKPLSFAMKLDDGTIIYSPKASAHIDLFSMIPESVADKVVDGGFVIGDDWISGGDMSAGLRPGEKLHEYYDMPRDSAAEATPEVAAPVPSEAPVPIEEATASEASRAPADLPGVTSNKEAVVNAERAARDLDPIIKEARISNAESIDRAQQVIQQNPLKPQEIITRLRENPQERTISLEDSAVLLVERTKLNNQRNELLSRAVDENLTPEERATAKAEFATLEGRLGELDQAAQDARSTWGRFGQLWQRSMRQDFTLENLERRARMTKGEALSPEETSQVRAVAEEVQTAQKAADEAVVQAENRLADKAVDDTIADIAKQPDADPGVRSLTDRIIARLDANVESAQQRLRQRFTKLGSVPDPLILADFTVIAASKIAKGVVKFGQWSAEMIREFGEGAQPYIQQAWDAANVKVDQMVEAATSDKKKRAAVKQKIQSVGQQQDRVIAAIGARVQEGESIDGLGNYVQKLAETFVRGGVKDRTALVSSVKGVLDQFSPGITDRQVADLISGYGKSTQLSKDPTKVTLRNLKGELQQVSKLEDLAAKEPLKKTGPERRTPSDEERRLIKQVNEAKKAAGVKVTDPETQLKSTMDSARTRFANEIKDLTFQIETGERPPSRTPVEYDQDIQVMRGLRDRLKQVVQELDGPREMTDEQRIRITTRGLMDSIAALENRIAGQQPKARRAAPDTPEIRALKAKRDALREELNEINSADSLLRENRKAEALVRSIEQAEATLAAGARKPAAEQGPESQLVAEARAQLQTVREAIQAKRDADPVVQQERMDAAEASVERAIKKLDEQLQAGDIAVTRAPSPAASQRLEDLRLQRDAMLRLRNQLRAEARPKPNPLEVAIKNRKASLKRQEADYEGRIARGEFGPRTRKEPVDLSSDAEAMDALARVQTAKDKFSKLQREWELKNRTGSEKVIGGIKATWDAVRNLKLSMDLSAPLQTAFAMASRPVEGVRAIGKGARAFAEQLFRNSDTYAKRVEQQIVNSPNNKNGIYKAMKLDLSEVTGDKREENAGSVLERLADLESRWQDIPDFVKGLVGLKSEPLVRGAKGIATAIPKVIGMGIKASNAGFGAIANHMRARTADAMLARWYQRRGQMPTKQQLELLGNQINAATGKGGLKGEEGIRALLFAPNYYLSILKQLSFQPVIKAGIKHEGAVAREVLEEYVRAAITMTSIGALQYLFGNRKEQTLDPRAHDFARAKTDKGTSLDFTMGRGAYATLAAQLATGEKIDKKGKVVKQDRSQAFLSFLKGRLSREISTGLTTAAGTDFKGKPLDAAGLAKELVTPLSWQDVDKVLKKEGLTRGAFIQMLNILGVTHRLDE